MAALPVEARGYPVPFFVAWIDGVPDFRVTDPRKIAICYNQKRCWVCGQTLGSYVAFVVGPMCAINRISSEPPSHRECAEWAAKACPFLARPHAKRREAGLPEESGPPAGISIRRNPGVALVWVTKSFRPIPAPHPDGTQGALFQMGEPREVLCFTEGRPSTLDEIRESVDTGIPLLRAEVNEQNWREVKAFETAVAQGRRLLGIAA